jgi:tellurite resistance protein TerC
MPVTRDYQGQKFFTRIDGKLWATPLFMVLLMVEFTDLIFAVDSIPAIFAITTNPFLVFTSNVFAILGLRALFFALAGLMGMFHYLSYGLAAILVFVGGKMLYAYAERAIVPEWPKFPIGLSLGIIVAILATSVIASLLKPKVTEEVL